MPPQRIFHELLIRLVLMSVIPALVALWLFGPLPAAGVGVALAGLEVWRVRRAVLCGMPGELGFAPAHPADYPWLDTAGFKAELDALAAIGFEPVGDYTVTYPGSPDGFARALLHRRDRVYAEVSQVKHEGMVLVPATSLQSVLSDGWSLQTSSRELMAVNMAFMRSPRAMWRSMPAAEPAELFEDHLALRERLIADLDLRVEGEGTLEGYFAVQRDAHIRRREAVRRTNVLAGILRGFRWERSGPTEWLGKYRPGTARP